LRLTGYYRKFVPHYGSIAKPLTNLLHHKQFSWNDGAQEAFVQLKSAMVTSPILAFSDFSKEFVIETDTCDSGIGAMLTQDGHRIAYFSKGLSEANNKMSTYEREFLAVMMAIDKWRSYLHKNPFVIKADHQRLCYLQGQTCPLNYRGKQ
jgi:hypothetical protein